MSWCQLHVDEASLRPCVLWLVEPGDAPCPALLNKGLELLAADGWVGPVHSGLALPDWWNAVKLG